MEFQQKHHDLHQNHSLNAKMTVLGAGHWIYKAKKTKAWGRWFLFSSQRYTKRFGEVFLKEKFFVMLFFIKNREVNKMGFLCFFFEKTVHYTDWLIGIFIMVYYNPYING